MPITGQNILFLWWSEVCHHSSFFLLTTFESICFEFACQFITDNHHSMVIITFRGVHVWIIADFLISDWRKPSKKQNVWKQKLNTFHRPIKAESTIAIHYQILAKRITSKNLWRRIEMQIESLFKRGLGSNRKY